MSSLTRTIVLAALAVAPAASALTLGPIVVHSDIGQPLRATIAVHHARGPLRVHLAPRAAFRAAGLTPPAHEAAIHCRVKGSRSFRRIVLTSTAPIDHPRLTLLLAVDSAHGSLVQEYHAALRPVLLPTMHVEFNRRPAMTPPPGPLAPPSPRTPHYRAVGPVRPGESLLQAARAMTPGFRDPAVLMEALVHRNPQAFVRGNANGLRAGAILHRPSRAAVAAISRAEALRFLRAQYAHWVGGETQAPAHQPIRALEKPKASAQGSVRQKAPAAPHIRSAPRGAIARALKSSSALSGQALPAPALPSQPKHPAPKASSGSSPTVWTPVAFPAVRAPRPSSAPTVAGALRAHPATLPQAAAPHPSSQTPHGDIPARAWIDLTVLIALALGLRHWLKQCKSTGASGLPFAGLFRGPAPVAPTPAAPTLAPASPGAAANASATPASTESATEPHSRPTPQPLPVRPGANGTLVVTVAQRDDQIIKLDLARAYVDLGEIGTARELLMQVRPDLGDERVPNHNTTEERDG
ncbi:MAG: hypothetical protein M0037_00190 [Betaproteobacteria bacterium]|nr:hypothetical protein [Betaproteobacteria bacterium]